MLTKNKRITLFLLFWLLSVGHAAFATTLSGTVFEDITGDLLSDGDTTLNDTSGDQVAIANANICLFADDGNGSPDSSDSLISCQLTGASGAYTFSGVIADSYWLAVQGSSLLPSTGEAALAEQTYAPTDGLCVDPSDKLTFKTLTASGACYGGKEGKKADAFTGIATSLANAEHIAGVVTSGSPISGIDFGFSFNVVTNTNTSGQGSIAQFVTNANSILAANTMRFVPAVCKNNTTATPTAASCIDSAQTYWKVDNKAVALTDSNTTLDGTAYNMNDGILVLNTNNIMLGTGGTVGVDEVDLLQLNAPELEMTRSLITITGAHDTTLRNLALNTATQAVTHNSGDNLLIENCLIGSKANEFVTNNGGKLNLTASVAASGLIIRNNLFAVKSGGIGIKKYADDMLIQGNELTGTGGGGAIFTSTEGFKNSIIKENLIRDFANEGIYDVSTTNANNSENTLIENNTITGISANTDAMYINVNITGDTTPYSISKNALSNNGTGTGSAGISLGNSSRGIKISQNTFEGHYANAVDLNNNGVSINTDSCVAKSTGNANNNLARPEFQKVSTDAGNLTINASYCNSGTFTLELYKAASDTTGDVGSDGVQAGEGMVLLKSYTGQTGGTLTDTLPLGVLEPGEQVTLIAIREDDSASPVGIKGDTSEFSANAVVYTKVSGHVFEDITGNQISDGDTNFSDMAGDQRSLEGVVVRSWLDSNSNGTLDVGDTQVGVTTTDLTGYYELGLSSYGFITVDAPTTNWIGTTGLMSEQTYASSNNYYISSSGAVRAFCDNDGLATTEDQAYVNRACYGGRNGALADATPPTTFTTQPTKPNLLEHVTLINIGGNALNDIDFGFSFNVVTNTNTSGQGSVKQFIEHANAISGVNAMRFVPASCKNDTDTSCDDANNTYWKLTTTALPTLIDDSTILDGHAYDLADGLNTINSNRVMLGTGGTVGVDAIELVQLDGPELELYSTSTSMLKVAANNVTIKNVALNSRTSALIHESGDYLVLEKNAIGMAADDFSVSSGGKVLLASTAPVNTITIRKNMFAVNSGAITNTQAISDLTITGNEITGSGGNGAIYTATNGFKNSEISNNLIRDFANEGIYDASTGTDNSTVLLIKNNTITGGSVSSADAIYVNVDTTGDAERYEITRNVITDNGGTSAGSGVALGSKARGIKISQNHFSGNSGSAIDLDNDGASTNTDACTASATSAANHDLARPTITSGHVASGMLTINGTYCTSGTFTLELYQAAPGSGDSNAGEGAIYVKSLTGQTGGSFTFDDLAVADLPFGRLTVLAIREDDSSSPLGIAGDTSEFSENYMMNIVVKGTVFEDITGDGVPSGETIDAGDQRPIVGTIVRLWEDSNGDGEFNSGDTQIATTTTAADGSYSFPASGMVFVSVDAPAIDGGSTSSGIVGEQTYASADGVQLWALCDKDGQQTSTDNLMTSTDVCFGGRHANKADANPPSTVTAQPSNPALLEHVTKMLAGSEAAPEVNFGFSFNVVTNTNATGQGSVDQFVDNANVITGSNTMRFVPATCKNNITATVTATSCDSAAETYWKTTLSASQILTDSATTLDGTVYDYNDGVTVIDSNTELQGSGASVGMTPVTIKQQAPDLELYRTTSGMITITGANDITLKNLALNGGTNAILHNSGDNLTIENNIIGAKANDFVANAGGNIKLGSTTASSDITIKDNLFAVKVGAIFNTKQITNMLVQGNEFIGTGGSGAIYSTTDGFKDSVIKDNYFNAFANEAIYDSSTEPDSSSNLRIENNTLSDGPTNNVDAIYIDVDTSGDTNPYVITQNIITNNGGTSGGSAIVIESKARGIEITANTFGGNSGNAIDLDNDGVSANTDDCTAAAVLNANNNMARPTITSAINTAGTVTVTGTLCNTSSYTVELYEAVSGTGDSNAGEGAVYKTRVTGQTGGTFSIDIAASELPLGNVTVLAIDEATHDTSEFSVNSILGAPIKGAVFEDISADSMTSSETTNTGDQRGLEGVLVRLWQDSNSDGLLTSGDTQIATTTTAADGSYQFLASGTLFVTVDAPIQDGSGASGILAEQTYAAANGTTIWAFCDPDGQLTTTDEFKTTDGGCYGGRHGFDADATPPSPNTNQPTKPLDLEHVSKVQVSAEGLEKVDFGFSFNVVTNTKTSGQGSFANFINNANTISGDNAMRFVPVTCENNVTANPTVASCSSADNTYWKISPSATTTLSDAGTTLDGTAYDLSDGLTEINPNTLEPSAGRAVGTDKISLATVEGPELELYRSSANMITIDAANTTIKDIALNGGTTAVLHNSGDNLTLTSNVVGGTAVGQASLGGKVLLAATSSASNIDISNNYFTVKQGAITNTNVVSDMTINQNEMTGSGGNGAIYSTANGWFNTTIKENFITLFANEGIYDISNGAGVSSNVLIENNSILSSSGSSDAVYLDTAANNYVVSKNTITGNSGGGVVLGVQTKGVKVTQNYFSGNTDVDIDLNNDGVSANLDACNADSTSTANNDLASPTVSTATGVNGVLDITGTMCATGSYTVEFYTTDDSQSYHEYIGSAVNQTGGSFTFSMTDNLHIGDKVTALVIRETVTGGTIGDTSEFAEEIEFSKSAARLSAVFTPRAVKAEDIVTAGFNLYNTNPSTGTSYDFDITDITFTNTLEDNFVVADPANITNTCDIPGTVTATPGSNVISVVGAGMNGSSNGGTGVCRISVDVTPQIPGTYYNSADNISNLSASVDNFVTTEMIVVSSKQAVCSTPPEWELVSFVDGRARFSYGGGYITYFIDDSSNSRITDALVTANNNAWIRWSHSGSSVVPIHAVYEPTSEPMNIFTLATPVGPGDSPSFHNHVTSFQYSWPLNGPSVAQLENTSGVDSAWPDGPLAGEVRTLSNGEVVTYSTAGTGQMDGVLRVDVSDVEAGESFDFIVTWLTPGLYYYEGLGAMTEGQCLGVPGPMITLEGVLGTNRYDDNDQFTLQIKDSSGNVLNSTDASTTAGSGRFITEDTGTTGYTNVEFEQTYTLTQVPVDTAVDNYNAYTKEIACTNADEESVTVLPSGEGDSFTVTIKSLNDFITCKLVDTNVAITLSGHVFEDSTGDLLTDGDTTLTDVIDDQRRIEGVTVRAWEDVNNNAILDDGDKEIASTTTDISGSYSLLGKVDTTVFITVDAPVLDSAGVIGVLGEQTYASSNDIAADAEGAIHAFCDVNADNLGTHQLTASGACYGGRRIAVTDQPATIEAEHITAIKIGNDSIGDIDFGFTFNVDRGDAPDGGVAGDGTNSNNYGDASHLNPVDSPTYLGALMGDVDKSLQTSADASADNADGGVDEDALSTPIEINLIQSYSLTVDCVGTGQTNAWVDFNGNGIFDTSEAATSAEACSATTAGKATLLWDAYTDYINATPLDTFMRLRISSNGSRISLPNGLALDGEVEDYVVSLVVDMDGDGIADSIDIDDDNDGILDIYEGDSLDSDGDGVLNLIDLDSDNDGIPDNVEAQKTIGYKPLLGTDSDSDGLDDAYDEYDDTVDPANIDAVSSAGLAPVDTDGGNTDGDGTEVLPDYLDIDSDDDDINDIEESGLGLIDGNLDGMTDSDVGINGLDNSIDEVGVDDYSDPNGKVNAPEDDLTDLDKDASKEEPLKFDVDYRDTEIVLGYVVKGYVYEDGNVNETLDTGDYGIDGVTVVLHDLTNNTCVSTQTQNGEYRFAKIEEGTYDVYESEGEAIPKPFNCPPNEVDPSGYRSTTSNKGQVTVVDADIAGPNFGDLPGATFEPDHSDTLAAGDALNYHHTFTAKAGGILSVTTSGTGGTGWRNVLYIDNNCDGVAEGLLTGNISVITGQQVCIVNRVISPTTGMSPERHNTQVTATLDSGNALAGSIDLSAVDVTTITAGNIEAAPIEVPQDPTQPVSPTNPVVTTLPAEKLYSKLELRKTVENLTQSTTETENQNQALPGDILKYRIYYSNVGNGPLNELEVNDTVPAYTELNGIAGSCDITPPDLTCTPVVDGDALSWEFSGSMAGGEEGVVSYEVVID